LTVVDTATPHLEAQRLDSTNNEQSVFFVHSKYVRLLKRVERKVLYVVFPESQPIELHEFVVQTHPSSPQVQVLQPSSARRVSPYVQRSEQVLVVQLQLPELLQVHVLQVSSAFFVWPGVHSEQAFAEQAQLPESVQ
jgi:hypothetical protein